MAKQYLLEVRDLTFGFEDQETLDKIHEELTCVFEKINDKYISLNVNVHSKEKHKNLRNGLGPICTHRTVSTEIKSSLT